MRITVNGNEIQMEEAKSVESYLLASGYQMKRIAVELNGDILPKYQYSETMLKAVSYTHLLPRGPCLLL